MKIHSADNFFIDAQGVYRFDSRKISDAHAWCLKGFLQDVLSFNHKKLTVLRGIPGSGKSTYCQNHQASLDLVVDNTNINLWEMSPYLAIGAAYGLEVEVATLLPQTFRVAACRNVHGVPEKSCERMWDNMNRATSAIPKHWNPKTIQV